MNPVEPHRNTGRRNRGFTLLEVLAAIFLTSIISAFVVGFYINLSDSSSRATKIMREAIRATAILNRMTRDLDGVSLIVKAEEADPLDHPWYFVAENDHAFGGSDKIRFISRNHIPIAGSTHSSDLIQVAYQVVGEDDDSLSLYRWTRPSLPMGFDPSFPRVDDEGTFIVADGLASLELRFMTPDGEWVDVWDSTQIERSGELPMAVLIDLSLLPDTMAEDQEDENWRHYTRQINLRARPLNLELMALAKQEALAQAAGTATGGGGAEEVDIDGDGIPDVVGTAGTDTGGPAQPGSVAECVRTNWTQCTRQFGVPNCTSWSTIQSQISGFGLDLPWCQ
ncbi:MAG: prepilin-type N-terminal cleavage/methylation domain-containing protein [Myxococcota bacterium]